MSTFKSPARPPCPSEDGAGSLLEGESVGLSTVPLSSALPHP